MAFFIALTVSIPLQTSASNAPLAFAFPILLTIILVGILFDMIGVAAAAADETPFHSMAAKRVPGSRHALRLVQRADRVASFSNDLVGDIAGTISGAAGAAIALRLINWTGYAEDVTTTVMIGVVAALTVGGKAATKGLALHRANEIILIIGRLLYWLDIFAHLGRKGRSKQGNRRERD